MAPLQARRFLLGGRVQGVGFRPFVYRTAERHALAGWVRNLAGQVEILAAGRAAELTAFGAALLTEAPAFARPVLLSDEAAVVPDGGGFRILPSRSDAPAGVQLPPDQTVCAVCLAELCEPTDRRYRYPFLSCTQCGPRYTVIERLPYDRANTTLAAFPLCPACAAEYADPADRRCHAETTACAVCGPRLMFGDARGEAALAGCIAALRGGQIVAVKGIGGYHLMCDAACEAAVMALRTRKHRPHKPFAVMFPDVATLASAAVCEPAAIALLSSPARPIVLLARRAGAPLAEAVAPGSREVGALLPYSPLHHLLLAGFGGKLVCTSANRSGEPVLTDNADAEAALAGIADAFLHHDRPIRRPADDPVYRSIGGRPRPLRLGRGTAPVELRLARPLPHPVLALGAQGKVTVALGWGDRAVVSPHLADMGSPRSLDLLRSVAEDLQALHGVRAAAVACDAHPGYATSRFAARLGLPVHAVPHHRAHASALAGEHPDTQRWLVFTWDGAGLGEDGTIWGGEALLGRPGEWRRVGSLRPFALPGGDRVAREPWRSALSLMWEAGAWEADTAWAPAGREVGLLRQAWQRGVNCPRSSAAGRLFDAAAAMLGLLDVASHEGHAPMLLEAACSGIEAAGVALPLGRGVDGVWRSDWAPLLPLLLDGGRTIAERAAALHASLAGAIRDQAAAILAEHGPARIGLTGGVMQNQYLVGLILGKLTTAVLPEQLPCNDAAISFGQLVEVATA
jgi:hydrogenase maturation protein HypF